jgi:hypothetical protein
MKAVVRGTVYNFDKPVLHTGKPVDELLVVARIGQHVLEAGKLSLHARAKQRGTAGVLDCGCGDHHQHEQPQRVHEAMPFAALHLCARSIAHLTPHFGRFDTLTVDNGQPGFPIASVAGA